MGLEKGKKKEEKRKMMVKFMRKKEASREQKSKDRYISELERS